MQIGRKDLLWNYAATSMRILSGIIVLPITLRMLPSEEMGIWSIFLSLMTVTSLLDFGFSNSFSRNVTYVYSGVKELKTKGYAVAESSEVDYGLLKSLLSAMKRYYGIVALVFLLFFVAGSPFYMSSVLEQYSGDKQTIWIAWYIFGALLAYELFTYCYNAILQGRGMVKRSTQITVLSQSVRIAVTIIFLLCGLQIISLVLGLLIGDILNRILLYFAFYDKETKKQLKSHQSTSVWQTIKILSPNSLKIGFVILGNFLRNQAIVIIAPFYLSLQNLAEYGISKQLIALIATLGMTWHYTFLPPLSKYRVQKDFDGVKRLYIKGQITLFAVFIVLGAAFLLFGNTAFLLIKSKTSLLCNAYLFLMLVFSLLESNQSVAYGVVVAKNEVPFFKANIISGIASVMVLWMMFEFTSLKVLSLILSTGLVLCAYLNWKLPYTIAKELQITVKDYIGVVKEFWKENKKNN